jgi:2-polyprenyl-3-methyl-5-hydroxy-6-metoxy-1,4-benzoquinol methylase
MSEQDEDAHASKWQVRAVRKRGQRTRFDEDDIRRGEPHVTPVDSPLAVVLATVPDVAGLRILDVGCGSGALAEALAMRGADVLGLDPGEAAVARARAAVRRARIEQGRAEALPAAVGSIDLVVMANALHHVPQALMGRAFAEAHRVLKPEGHLIVVEPEARGSFNEVLRLIDDEEVIRGQAQEALAAAVAGGPFRRVRHYSYDRPGRFADVAGFLADVTAVDPARQAVAASRSEAIAAAFAAHAVADGQGFFLLAQPIIADVLVPVPPK